MSSQATLVAPQPTQPRNATTAVRRSDPPSPQRQIPETLEEAEEQPALAPVRRGPPLVVKPKKRKRINAVEEPIIGALQDPPFRNTRARSLSVEPTPQPVPKKMKKAKLDKGKQRALDAVPEFEPAPAPEPQQDMDDFPPVVSAESQEELAVADLLLEEEVPASQKHPFEVDGPPDNHGPPRIIASPARRSSVASTDDERTTTQLFS